MTDLDYATRPQPGTVVRWFHAGNPVDGIVAAWTMALQDDELVPALVLRTLEPEQQTVVLTQDRVTVKD